VEAALARAGGERAAAAESAEAQGELAAAEADRARAAGARLLELAEHAGLVAAAYEARCGGVSHARACCDGNDPRAEAGRAAIYASDACSSYRHGFLQGMTVGHRQASKHTRVV
jgi:hypothetical protein